MKFTLYLPILNQIPDAILDPHAAKVQAFTN